MGEAGEAGDAVGNLCRAQARVPGQASRNGSVLPVVCARQSRQVTQIKDRLTVQAQITAKGGNAQVERARRGDRQNRGSAVVAQGGGNGLAVFIVHAHQRQIARLLPRKDPQLGVNVAR